MRPLKPVARSPLPQARAYHALVALGPHLVLFGGRGSGGNLLTQEQLAVYDTLTDEWALPGACFLGSTIGLWQPVTC